MIELALTQNQAFPATDADCFVTLAPNSENEFPAPLVVNQRLVLNLVGSNTGEQRTLCWFQTHIVTNSTVDHNAIVFKGNGQCAEFIAVRNGGLAWRLIGGQYHETADI